MQLSFDKRKQDCLSKTDKSSIGSWDKPIRELCQKITKNNKYYTLSSCSGRIVLIKNIKKKTHDLFLFRSHNKINLNQLKNQLEKSIKINIKEGILFKQEPPILHVCCETLKDAQDLLFKARE